MTLELYNAGIEAIDIKQGGLTTRVHPGQSINICTEHDEVNIMLLHVVKDRFHPIWYLLNALFTLEQMRTTLVVDGQYSVKLLCEHPCIKVKDREYVFDRNTSYQTFVFSSDKGTVEYKELKVARSAEILRKAKYLYLFGGVKTFLPLSAVALFAEMIEMASVPCVTAWMWLGLVGTAMLFVSLLINYSRSINALKNAMDEKYIIRYLLSERKECRKLSDDLVQKHWDTNAGDEMYW